MNQKEKYEISMLPDKYRPMGAWSYVGYSILYAIPLVGLICLIVFALSGGNVSRRSFARSYFCAFLLAILITVVLVVLFVFCFPGVWETISSYLQNLWSQMPFGK